MGILANRYEQLLQQVESGTRLSQVLSSALRFSTEAGDEDLNAWIQLELVGYVHGNPTMTEQTVVPEYRSVPGQWVDVFGRALLIQDPKLTFLNETRLRQGVAELEGYARAQGTLSMPLPEFAEVINRTLHVDVSFFRFNPTAIDGVLANIRTELLQRLIAKRSELEPVSATVVEKFEEDVIELRPNVYGIGINLRALWKRWKSA